MPDLNSVPASPHGLGSSRRQSNTQMPPPPQPVPASPSLNILPSNQNALNHQQQQGSTAVSSSVPSPQLTASQPVAAQSDVNSASGPGPLRHPRPLTASELHMQLEKEQEALVNRLTRELSLLRTAHNASVASNASSASATNSAHDPIGDSSLLSGAGFSIPTTRRHHRTSSATSQGHQLPSSSFESRGTHFPRPPPPVPLTRQDSSQSRSSQAQTSISGHPPALDPSNYFHNQRVPHSANSVAATPGSAAGGGGDQMSPGLMPATLRYEETAHYRGELEMAKKENEVLKKRVRELEKMVRERRESDAGRNRSESVSTTASASVAPTGGSSIAGPRDSSAQRLDRGRASARQSVTSVAIGVPEDEVKVGESAATYVRRVDGE